MLQVNLGKYFGINNPLRHYSALKSVETDHLGEKSSESMAEHHPNEKGEDKFHDCYSSCSNSDGR